MNPAFEAALFTSALEIPDRLMTDSHDKQHGAAMARQTASQRAVKMTPPRNHPANTMVVIKVLKLHQRKAQRWA